MAQVVLPTPREVTRGNGTLTVQDLTAGNFRQTSGDMPHEAYRLTIDSTGITIATSSYAGTIYAIQTLNQLCTHTADGKRVYPYINIYDAPRMAWRGFMIDSGRQYQSVATIKKYIDMAAMLKMNVLHWHLTEGLGWRFASHKYPRLATIGANVGDGPEQHGCYTKSDIEEIVRYASQHAVTVVPEIDMPGHAEAALNAYPGLCCTGEAPEIPETGFTSHIFCAGKDSTLQFLRDILDEVCEVFPSPYIHLGGDEAPKTQWDKCPHCQRRIAEKGLKDSHDLQLWFSAQMARHLDTHGRRTIFWNDVVARDGYPLPHNAIVQWWDYRVHGTQGLDKARERGHQVVMSPNYYCYLNFPIHPWKGYDKGRTFNMEDAYLRNPAHHTFAADSTSIMGMTAALWTDYGVTEDMIDSRLFPRIFALAEQMWCEQLMPLDEFVDKVRSVEPQWRCMGYEFGEF